MKIIVEFDSVNELQILQDKADLYDMQRKMLERALDSDGKAVMTEELKEYIERLIL